ncbi:hypothetical protein MBAV_005642 [Candidatus Magnetobacterium bavaricum]|uniref:Uncharacterized protein n=1 Tax=Candidatus Magnetobacterium bavaricum TaxID=29290 RepID=A0A0F3GJU2_9BACT|nr:hypothetical protein MBAV_005642 [Candidatus Magnetobacterium bavaricum]
MAKKEGGLWPLLWRTTLPSPLLRPGGASRNKTIFALKGAIRFEQAYSGRKP